MIESPPARAARPGPQAPIRRSRGASFRPGRWVQVAVCLAGLACWPSAAAAQWYIGTFTGGNVTHAATVILDQPGRDRLLEFENVHFAARPLESPQYYGARLGYFFDAGRFGLELEFLHVKVIGLTDRLVTVTGREAGVPVNAQMRMDAIIQRHAMTHGLNFLMANVAWRRALGGTSGSAPVTLVLRAGAGPVVPGVDSVVDHVSVQEYQYAGLGGQLAAGLDIRLRGPLSATVEYKFTGTRPIIDLACGTSRMTALTHHVAAGFALGFSR